MDCSCDTVIAARIDTGAYMNMAMANARKGELGMWLFFFMMISSWID
jgi:hypothetical protein